MSCGSLRARLLTAALIGVSAMPILAQSGSGPRPPGMPPPDRSRPSRSRPSRSRPSRSRPDATGSPPAAGQPAPATPAAGAPAAGQPAQQTPAFRTGINFVRVDALVTDTKGNAVADLQQSDFDVYEDNKLQNVEASS